MINSTNLLPGEAARETPSTVARRGPSSPPGQSTMASGASPCNRRNGLELPSASIKKNPLPAASLLQSSRNPSRFALVRGAVLGGGGDDLHRLFICVAEAARLPRVKKRRRRLGSPSSSSGLPGGGRTFLPRGTAWVRSAARESEPAGGVVVLYRRLKRASL